MGFYKFLLLLLLLIIICLNNKRKEHFINYEPKTCHKKENDINIYNNINCQLLGSPMVRPLNMYDKDNGLYFINFEAKNEEIQDNNNKLKIIDEKSKSDESTPSPSPVPLEIKKYEKFIEDMENNYTKDSSNIHYYKINLARMKLKAGYIIDSLRILQEITYSMDNNGYDIEIKKVADNLIKEINKVLIKKKGDTSPNNIDSGESFGFVMERLDRYIRLSEELIQINNLYLHVLPPCIAPNIPDKCTIPTCGIDSNTPYTGCYCREHNTPMGCVEVPCIKDNIPYEGCSVPTCIDSIDNPYLGCTPQVCTHTNTPYQGCIEPSGGLNDESRSSGSAATAGSADVPTPQRTQSWLQGLFAWWP